MFYMNDGKRYCLAGVDWLDALSLYPVSILKNIFAYEEVN